jgi:RNA polymerase sigma-70 factor (ECF subfamily)
MRSEALLNLERTRLDEWSTIREKTSARLKVSDWQSPHLSAPLSNHSTTLRYWLDRHNAGDPAATQELIRFSQDRFRRLVRSRLRQFARLRRFEDSDDVLVGVQARFAKALEERRFAEFQDFLRFGAALVRHQLVDFTRHYFGPLGKGRFELHRQDAQHSDYGDRIEPADRQAGPAELARQTDIDAVIEGLPADHQNLFHALYYLGLTQQDAADVLDISLSTLKRRWLDARQLFLERYGYDDLL